MLRTAGAVVAAVTVLATAVGALRAATHRRVRQALAARPPRATGVDGVVPGAQAIHLRGTGMRAACVLHGFNDTPQSVSHLACTLHARGWTVTVPLLAAHGRGFEIFARDGSASEWVEGAREAWTRVRAESPDAVLIGQSMGGAIAVVLATESPPAGLVLLAPFLRMGLLARVLARVWPLWALAVPVLLSSPRRGMLDPDARANHLGLGMFTPRLVRELARVTSEAWKRLARVTVPTLVLQARSDYRIPTERAERAFARLAAADKTLEWFDGTGHVIAADARRDDVAERVAGWLDSRLSA
jgi:carboxylesterase